MKMGDKFAWAASILGFIVDSIAIVTLLYELTEPNSLHVSLSTPLWGVSLDYSWFLIIWFLTKRNLDRYVAQPESKQPKHWDLRDTAGNVAFGTSFLMSPFFVALAAVALKEGVANAESPRAALFILAPLAGVFATMVLGVALFVAVIALFPIIYNLWDQQTL